MVRDARPTTEKRRIGSLQRYRQQLAIVRQTGGSGRGPHHGRGGLHNARPGLTRSMGRGEKSLAHKGGAARPEAAIDSHAEISGPRVLRGCREQSSQT
jgi:hypothetical protein